MAWFISYKTSTLTVAALDANGVRTGRTALPAPVLPLSKRGKPGRCSISDAYATPDGAMLEVGATISDDFLSFRVYPKYRTYRIHVLHDRLTLEKTAEDTSTMHEEFIGHHIADQRVTTPSGEWAIPGGAQSSGQTPDGRYAFALRGGPPPQRPSALDIIRAKWNALRRVPAPPTKAAATYVVSVYEQPGTLRFSTVLPLDTSNGYEYSLGIDVSPDGHAALVQAGTGHATHLVRW
jgi:hypothetical protein